MNDDLQAALAGLTEGLRQHYKPALLPGRETVFQFSFDEGEPFYLHAHQEGFAFLPGEAAQPSINLYLRDHHTCHGLLTGQLDGMRAFMEGAYRADGNIVLSQLLLYLFKAEDAVIAYQVQD